MREREDIERVVAECVGRVLALEPSEVKSEHELMGDLGAESLDLVELMYLLEAEFGFRLEQRDLSLTAQLGLSEQETHVGEVITPRALEALRERFPDKKDMLVQGVTRRQLAPLLTVGAIVEAMSQRLAAAEEATPGASGG